MPRRYLPEFAVRFSICLGLAGRVAELVRDLEISDQTVYSWRRQELIDTGQMPGVSSGDQADLVAARRRIAELETELAIHRRAAELLTEAVRPKDRFATNAGGPRAAACAPAVCGRAPSGKRAGGVGAADKPEHVAHVIDGTGPSMSVQAAGGPAPVRSS